MGATVADVQMGTPGRTPMTTILVQRALIIALILLIIIQLVQLATT